MSISLGPGHSPERFVTACDGEPNCMQVVDELEAEMLARDRQIGTKDAEITLLETQLKTTFEKLAACTQERSQAQKAHTKAFLLSPPAENISASSNDYFNPRGGHFVVR
jgi:hypothetical protein